MKKSLLPLLLLLLLAFGVSAKPVFIQGSYLIGCLQVDTIGVVTIGGTGTDGKAYPLVFNPDRDGETAIPADYWIIKEEAQGQYSFQNAETKQYIKYDNTATAERTSLVLVNSLQSDLSTLFTLELKQTNNISYYAIRSVSNTLKGWNKRSANYGGYLPVGTYSISGVSNELFVFYTSDGKTVADDFKVPVQLPVATQNLGPFSTYFSDLTFGYKVPVVDTSNKQLYLTIPESSMGTNVVMTVSYMLKSSVNKLYINDINVASGTDFTFSAVQALKTYKIEVKNGSSVLISGTINFTSLPIVQIYSDATIQSVYTLGRIVVTEPEAFVPAEIDLSDIRYRGATAASKPKKSYALKLKNPIDGSTPIYKSYLGLRTDNNWVLDAMYIDPARMRNRVSTDFWNDFSTPPYFKPTEPNMINGTRGKFVEVFLNDSYNGLYCMTEKVDRKQLNVKKFKVDTITGVVTQRGAIYKSASWSVATLYGNPYWNNTLGRGALSTYRNTSETWDAWEVKYPDLGDGEAIEWKPIYDAISVVYQDHSPTPIGSSDANFVSKVADYFDLPVFLDYYLFIELMLATDNHGKNTYLSVYDQSVSSKVTISPWDMDGTWGRRWDGSNSLTRANQDFSSFIKTYEHMENNLYIRLRNLNYNEFNTKIIERYRYLRANYFTYENIMQRFLNYRHKFVLSGAETREKAKWSLGSFDTEMNYLSSWITDRLEYLDQQYLGGSYTSIKEVAKAPLLVFPTVTSDKITISNVGVGDRITIYSVQGMLMMQTIATSTTMDVNLQSIKPGVYIVKAANKTNRIIRK